MKLALDLAGDQEPARARFDRGQPVGVDRSSITPGFLEWTRRQLLDDSVKEVLAKLHLGGRVDPCVREHRPAENAEE
jgi:hypothetical protein